MRASRQRVKETAIILVDAEDQDARAGKFLDDQPRAIDPVTEGHGDIHEHQVGLGVAHQAQGVETIARLADHLQVRL